MARIAGINIPQNKNVNIGLTYIYGIGNKFSQQICNNLNIPSKKRIHELTEDEIGKIREYIDKNFTRHKKKLPVRGQRTRCNARTRKGKAIAIAGKKLTPLKK